MKTIINLSFSVFYLSLLIFGFSYKSLISKELPEMLIGEFDIKPGIHLVFEGAIKDSIEPQKYFLKEKQTDIHIEVLANWNNDAPDGSPLGGFIPYLEIDAIITNQNTDESSKVFLTPHLNMSDNYHYAQNIKLPGKRNDIYQLVFNINAPESGKIGLHYDWRQKVGNLIVETKTFTFSNLDFSAIAKATRR